MARTISTIYNSIIIEKESMSSLGGLLPETENAANLLSGLNSGSKVAVWRLWAWVTAAAIWVHENLWDAFKAEVDAIVAAAIPGTAQWYRNMCLLYQHGDNMVYSNYKYQYATTDTDKQIIKRASATEQGGNVLIKVAKESGGCPVKLTTEELEAFTEYIDKIKFAGTFCPVISQDADLVNLDIEVHYDPQVMNSSGELLSDTSVKPAEDAINNYLANIEWNGVMKVSGIFETVMDATGVDDLVINSVEAKASGESTYNTVERSYSTVAGYIIANTLTITYTSV